MEEEIYDDKYRAEDDRQAFIKALQNLGYEYLGEADDGQKYSIFRRGKIYMNTIVKWYW